MLTVMSTIRTLGLVISIFIVGVFIISCDDSDKADASEEENIETLCPPGESEICKCEDGKEGLSKCARDGRKVWKDCECGPGNSDTDIDTDSDSDGDSDADADTDTHADDGIDVAPDCADGHGRLDENTGLSWQHPRASVCSGWPGANDHCDKLTLGGHNDWRLPSIE